MSWISNSRKIYLSSQSLLIVMLAQILIGIAGSYLLAEVYKKYASAETKKKWESFVEAHHGEAGAIIAIVGITAKSATLVGSGVGLMLHDRDDAKNWFK